MSLEGTDSPAQGAANGRVQRARGGTLGVAGQRLWNPAKGEINRLRKWPRNTRSYNVYLSLSGICRPLALTQGSAPVSLPSPGGCTLGWRIPPFQGFGRGSQLLGVKQNPGVQEF